MIIVAIAQYALAQSTFTSCSTWNSVCVSIQRPNTCLYPIGICYNPAPNQVCAGCICTDGPDKGKVMGTSVVSGFDDATCKQFFATNSTPTDPKIAPVLPGSSTSFIGGTPTISATSSKSGDAMSSLKQSNAWAAAAVIAVVAGVFC